MKYNRINPFSIPPFRRAWVGLIMLLVAGFASAKDNNQKTKFSAAEQSQISIQTPGLFDKSDAFLISLGEYGKESYSFPLPVGKAELSESHSELKVKTKKGDAVKCMFDGTVRLSYKHKDFGNVIVVRHDNGLETVYGNNAQNLVKVGDKVRAGQTIAIVGGDDKEDFLRFAIMVDGHRINPESMMSLGTHNLKNQTIKIKKLGSTVKLTILGGKKKGSKDLMAYTGQDAFETKDKVTFRLSDIPSNRWAYPLPGSHVISPYGGARRHSGVDIKTKPNDDILAAFDGVVVLSGPHYGYGNCIEIQHANGLKTLYSHQSKNLVKVGDEVKAGQVIGLTGRTGRATTEHLHFELFCKGTRYDPAKLFDHQNHCLKDIKIEISKTGSIRVVK